MKYKLKKQRFLSYMFADKEDYLYWGEYLAEELAGEGKINLTLEEMLQSSGDIPVYYFDLQDESGHPEYIDPKNVKII